MDKFDSWHKCSISELECALCGRTKNKKEAVLGTMRVTRRFSARIEPVLRSIQPDQPARATFINFARAHGKRIAREYS